MLWKFRGQRLTANRMMPMTSSGANSKYLLLLYVPNGDTCYTYPYLDHSMSAEAKKHFDSSKLSFTSIASKKQ